MSRRVFVWLPATLLLTTAPPAVAQQPGKVPRIAWLTAGFLSSSPGRHEAFRQGLRELGYVEGKNILIDGAARKIHRGAQKLLLKNW